MAPKALRVSVPKDDGSPPWRRTLVIAAAGLALGMTWPSLAGIRIGPHVPGGKPAEEGDEAAAADASSAPALALPALASSAGLEPEPSGAEPARSKEQTVVVSTGTIQRCQNGKKQMKGSECGKLGADRVLVPSLQELKRCPSALGLTGAMEMGFDIDFDRKQIHVVAGKGDLPMSTVNGIVACAADYMNDVSAEKIPHEHTRYTVFYSLSFYRPGSAPPTEGASETASDDDSADRSLATVAWDSALVRDEPKTGKVLIRLVRGTRVKILSSRKDWYRVKIGSHEGWVYRGALGL
jgi:hypothetical protein